MLTNVERPRISVSHIYAWGVHLYTGMGLVVAGTIAYVLVSDDPWRFRDAFLLMAIGILIDATDGWFARRVRVKEVLPGFDGRRLDDLVDFLNYTCLPLLLIYQADLLPERQSGWLLVPLLATPMASARCRPKPTTASSWASLRTGTWSRFICTRCSRRCGPPSRCY